MEIFWFIFSNFFIGLSFAIIPDENVLAKTNLCKTSYCEFETSKTTDHQFALFSNRLEFKVSAAKDVHIIVAKEFNASAPLVDFCIGCNDNKKTTVNSSKSAPATTDTPNILNEKESRGFWISHVGNKILVGRQNEDKPFVEWQSADPLAANYIGFHTSSGKGSWIVGDSKCWVKGKGRVPQGAVRVGEHGIGNADYIARVQYKDCYKIGRIPLRYSSEIIRADGKIDKIKGYDVLALGGKKILWKRFSEDMKRKDFLNAVSAGQFGNKPILYVARMVMEGHAFAGYFDYEQKKCFTTFGPEEKTVNAANCAILFST